MAKLRSATAYRVIKRPYTRKSKYKKYSFIRGIPGSKVVMYHTGNRSKKFECTVRLIAKKDVNLRHNAIESARVAANKHLEAALGKDGYVMVVRAVPHNVMRDHPLATGAGADRFSSGMAASYGNPIGLSAHIYTGKIIMEVGVDKGKEAVAKEALRKATSKFPIPCGTKTEYTTAKG